MSGESRDVEAGGLPEGRYANYLEVGHNAFEFILDFGQFHRDDKHPRCHTRVVTSPAFAKIFLDTLRCAIDEYERNFGSIPDNKSEDISDALG